MKKTFTCGEHQDADATDRKYAPDSLAAMCPPAAQSDTDPLSFLTNFYIFNLYNKMSSHKLFVLFIKCVYVCSNIERKEAQEVRVIVVVNGRQINIIVVKMKTLRQSRCSLKCAKRALSLITARRTLWEDIAKSATVLKKRMIQLVVARENIEH